ncbi:GNAT family N-acetyltransferase [Tistrella mobilis]|uniref:GNAT family N-acetyltransferase n=1 Tax=Tistrella mobilis TaxID=171437 RepID=UPI0031F65307
MTQTRPRADDLLIRPARPDEAAALAAIEDAAAAQFARIGMDLGAAASDPAAIAARAAEGAVLAASLGGRLTGFAIVTVVDGNAHLAELDVAPDVQRRGIGRRLIEAVADRARAAGHHRLTLTTFRDVPWNGPWYRRLGFTEIAPAAQGPALRQIRQDEARRIDPLGPRIAMARPL